MTDHAHIWKLPSPNGTEAVMASCRLCGEEKPHWTGWRYRGAGTPWAMPKLIESARHGQARMRVKTHAKGGRSRL